MSLVIPASAKLELQSFTVGDLAGNADEAEQDRAASGFTLEANGRKAIWVLDHPLQSYLYMATLRVKGIRPQVQPSRIILST